MAFPVSEEATDQLAQWPQRARALFAELLDDAGSDLQREFIQRAVAAAHTPAEVHAFADELRGMSDEEAYEACTLNESAPEDYTVTQLLRAEADPLFAFELMGGRIEPNEDQHSSSGFIPPRRALDTIELEAVAPLDAVAAAVSKKKSSDSFEADSPGTRVKKLDWNDLPSNRPAPQKKDAGPSSSNGTRFLESLLAEATRGLAISWKEQDVDVPGGLTMADALASAAGALSRGIPVPCAVGPAPGDHRRFIVLMQLNTSGKNRAWQLYDPFSSELLWANEGDLLAKAELPFANKLNRRLTRIVLPQSLRSTF
ncbi:MAG: hypothetical protein Q8N23_00800 [Archangium sp.]|nr:hypothetical protein [Archangium sp.]MDP3151173.1 hypothetical protein [Archangium sp.]MDP3570186.1 hypothetical protein [Archangium sp.]